ncbi:aminopeptidase 2 [Fusarium proliferatum]|nr:aminopeptidase 2 [Fusarium proliferatum]
MCQKFDDINGRLQGQHGREVLPGNVKPTEYDVTLEIDLEGAVYKGKVVIGIELILDTTSIVLNAASNLQIDENRILIQVNGTDITSNLSTAHDREAETFTIMFGQMLPRGGKATLTLSFESDLTDASEKSKGLYRSHYKNKQGDSKFIASTQFEPGYARRAFPCFDEPGLKAEFTVTLITDKDLICLSNTEIELEEADGNRKTCKFQKTPIMSTYLLAFVIGDLTWHENTDSGIPVRVWVAPDQNVDHTVFAARIVAKSLKYFEREFGCKYPLSKLHLVAIPDFEYGAMENWGLIIGNQDAILLDSMNCTAAKQRTTVDIIIHEVAHQWLGNYVTWTSWEDYWLKAGLVTLISLRAYDKNRTQWDLDYHPSTFSLRPDTSYGRQNWMEPVKIQIESPNEISKLLNGYFYQKSMYILDMVLRYLTEPVFIKGVRTLIANYPFGCVRACDFWHILEEDSGFQLESTANFMAQSVVENPVITVTEDEGKSTIRVTQTFFNQMTAVKPTDESIAHPIFLTLQTTKGVQETFFQGIGEHEYDVGPDFCKLDMPLYLVAYSQSRLQKLAENFNNHLIDTHSILGILGDTATLTMAGGQKTSDLLTLINLINYSDDCVLDKQVNCLHDVQKAWLFEAHRESLGLARFMEDLTSRMIIKKGWDLDKGHEHILTNYLVNGDINTEKKATAKFAGFMEGHEDALNPTEQFSVFVSVVCRGGEKEYDDILRVYETAQDDTVRGNALRSLGYATDPKLVDKTLAYALKKVEEKAGDIRKYLSGLSEHAVGLQKRWDWLCMNWDVLNDRLPSGMGEIAHLCVEGFTTTEQIREAELFFESKGVEGFEQWLDGPKQKRSWVEKDKLNVHEWLVKSGYWLDDDCER